MDKVLSAIRNFPQVKLSAPVLYSWKNHWSMDPSWRPGQMEAHSYHHRIFSDRQKAEIASEIMENYVMTAKLFMSSTFRELAMKNSKMLEETRHNFNVWIISFKISSDGMGSLHAASI
jgi:hypothetical protein